MENVFSKIESGKLTFTTTANGRVQIQQTERNKLKSELECQLLEMFKQYLPDTISVERVKDGIALGILNDESNVVVPVVVDLTIKSLDYDIDAEVEDYNIALEAKKIKAEKAAIAKQKKIESDRILRERLSRKEN